MSQLVTASTLAPCPSWSAFRQAAMRIHDWTGMIFLVPTGAAGIGAMHLAIASPYGSGFGFGLFIMAVVQLSASGMAYSAIARQQSERHKEWTIRAYVVALAFATFRIFSEFAPSAALQPHMNLFIVLSWASWVVPLAVTELILQFSRWDERNSEYLSHERERNG